MVAKTTKTVTKLGRKPVNPQKVCLGKCQKSLPEDKFYKASTETYADGLYPICKQCVNEQVDIEDVEQVKDLLRKLDRPYIQTVWDASLIEAEKRNRAMLGTYIKNIQLGKFARMNWRDGLSITGQLQNDNTIKNDTNSKEQSEAFFIGSKEINLEQLEQLAMIWGEGHRPEEYSAFERKYTTLLNNYPHRTSLHIEALRNYVRYRVKEEIASAKNDSKSAKEWGGLAKDAATAAKINPSQLSKSDLSDGLDNFGVLVRSVEQAVDIIDILPRFLERPNDKVDFTIWCYINYVRRLQGLPLVEYKEIYQFYEERKKEYEEKDREDMLDDLSGLRNDSPEEEVDENDLSE